MEEAGALDLDAANANGCTVAHWASSGGDEAVCRYACVHVRYWPLRSTTSRPPRGPWLFLRIFMPSSTGAAGAAGAASTAAALPAPLITFDYPSWCPRLVRVPALPLFLRATRAWCRNPGGRTVSPPISAFCSTDTLLTYT